jgi:hypothetical protein
MFFFSMNVASSHPVKLPILRLQFGSDSIKVAHQLSKLEEVRAGDSPAVASNSAAAPPIILRLHHAPHAPFLRQMEALVSLPSVV